MHGAHIGGQRAGTFLELVRGVDPTRVLLVGVDVAKATWFVVASNLLGEVVVDGVRLVADRAGLAELERVLGAARARVDAAMVVVGIEAAGHHHQTLTGHLLDRDELVVRLLVPGAGGRGPQAAGQPAAQDRLAGRGGQLRAAGPRRGRAGASGRLGSGGVAAVVVGTQGSGGYPQPAAGSRPERWSTASGRVVRPRTLPLGSRRCCATCSPPRPVGCCSGCSPRGGRRGRVAATSVAALRGLFAVRGCRLTRPLAARLIGRAQAALPAHPAATVGKAATLAALLGMIDTLDHQIACLDAAMAPLLARTQGAKLTQLRGVGVVAAAGFVAFVGSTDRWAGWSKVWRAAGLDPARSQSGPTDARLGISREGSAWGRRAILDLAAAVCQQPGPWRDQLRTRTTQQHKPAKVALAATANAVGRTLFALMASGAEVDPGFEANRTAARKAGGRAA